MQRAFKKGGYDAPVHLCKDGEEARKYLQGEGEFADRNRYPFPRILITDLKMPRFSGFELLQWLKDRPECELIPRIVLSASSVDDDVRKAYRLGANAYFCKPANFERLVATIALNENYWAEALLPELPKRC